MGRIAGLCLLIGAVLSSAALGAAVGEHCTASRGEPGLARVAPGGWGFDVRNTRYRPDSTIDAGDNPVPMYSGTPLVHAGNLFVPLSSLEVGLTLNPFYGC